MKIYNSHIVKH